MIKLISKHLRKRKLWNEMGIEIMRQNFGKASKISKMIDEVK